MNKIRFISGIVAIYIMLVSSGYPQSLSVSTTGKPILSTDQPYEMYGDKFISSVVNNQRISKLIGHAKLVLKNDNITVTATEIWYHSDEKKMQAFKNVVIVKEDAVNGKIVATADMIEYYEIAKKVLLTGAPKVTQEKNEIKGDSITIEFADTGAIIEIEGNVNAMIYPRTKETKSVE
ncbi:MAG: hypothetical protein N3A72_06900 [bacterium]|nr:hypothetical protein [bacterium]